ncbi:MAG: tripartite tricarboxylate transporter substrate-binding protein [Armatimonadota bacterium]|nr:tripartite tricarboxylate transporter substrate-binding protein [Armatimonadota bacterium]
MGMRTRILAALGLAALIAAGAMPALSAPAYPTKPLEIIAPASAGGGWDLTARMTAKALAEEKLITTPITVTNMPGGSGAVAVAHMVTRRKGDTHVLAVMGSAFVATLARKVVPYTWKDITPIAAITGDFNIVAVRKDSTFNNLQTLLQVFKRDPALVTVAGGSAPGGLDHLAFSELAKRVGVDVTKVRYVPTGGGGDALALVLGGNVTVLSTSLSEVLAAFEAGQIRILGIMAPERLGGSLRGVPTAREQGLDFVYVNWRGFYMPPDIPADVFKFWEETITEKMVRSRTWAKILDDTRWAPFVLKGDRFRKFIEDDVVSTQRLLTELGLMR